MSAATVTVTGKYGPGFTATSTVISNVLSVRFDVANGMLFIETATRTLEYDINAATTVTCTVTGTNYAFTIS